MAERAEHASGGVAVVLRGNLPGEAADGTGEAGSGGRGVLAEQGMGEERARRPATGGFADVQRAIARDFKNLPNEMERVQLWVFGRPYQPAAVDGSEQAVEAGRQADLCVRLHAHRLDECA